MPRDCLECIDTSCKDENHLAELDDNILNILHLIEASTKNNIPYTNAARESANKASQRKHIPGWKEFVKPHKDEANFWFSEWRSAGRIGFIYMIA